jgi:serine/threonine protein phosphatase PrpC
MWTGRRRAAAGSARRARTRPPRGPTSGAGVAAGSPSALPEFCREVLEIGLDPVLHAEPRLHAQTQALPYRPDTVVDGGIAHGLTVRAASVRGRAKRFQGKPREDDFCLLSSEARGAIVIAVADGMGSAERSGLGAALAVRHAVATVEESLAECAPEDLDWAKIFNRAASALIVEHRRKQDGENSDRPDRPDRDELQRVSRDLGTTLTVAVVESSDDGRAHASVAAIGDSPAFRLAGGAYELLVGERESDEDFSTSSVIALPYLPEAEVRNVSLEAGEVLLVCTDGFSTPLSAGNSDVGRLFVRELRLPPPLPLWSQLVDFAKATYDDDRTLVAVWPSEFVAGDRGADAGEKAV